MNPPTETSRLADALGRFLVQHSPQASPWAVRLAGLCSDYLAQGHTHLDVSSLDFSDLAADFPNALPDALNALAKADFVGDGSGPEPLVLRGVNLYLARYWRASQRIRQAIEQRLASPTKAMAQTQMARQWLDRLFPQEGSTLDWQKLACAVALRQRFSILTGGPGTGKTTTVVRLLTVQQGLAQARGLDQGLRIRLAAPTGKAAARLNESIAGSVQHLQKAPGDALLQAALACVPTHVTTLHRLLGSRPGTRRLAYHAGHPLDLDVLVIDEASMMDFEMMDAVLSALPPHAQLVLLGDKDQLASVEAGAVLGELCARAEAGHYTEETCKALLALSGQDLIAVRDDPQLSHVAPGLAQWPDPDGTALDQAVVMLRHSRRFGARSGIGRFAGAVNQGDAAEVQRLLAAGLPDLICLPRDAQFLQRAGILSEAGYPGLFRAMQSLCPGKNADVIVEGVEGVEGEWDEWAWGLLQQQLQFQVLCALRHGESGVDGLNRRIESGLRALGLIPETPRQWYAGQPVLVRRNQPGLGLANGDMGLVLKVPSAGRPEGRLRVAFAGTQSGQVRWVSPARLAAVETAYALTVHKSQGSEFNRVVLVLPEQPGPLMTRELLYTGATRARQVLTLVLPLGSPVIGYATGNPTRRTGSIWAKST